MVRDYQDKGAKGVAAVIDKDMGGELLAEDCQADYLFLLTAVEYVCTSFGTPEQKALVDVSADEAEALANAGEFGRAPWSRRCALPLSSCAAVRAAPALSVR